MHRLIAKIMKIGKMQRMCKIRDKSRLMNLEIIEWLKTQEIPNKSALVLIRIEGISNLRLAFLRPLLWLKRTDIRTVVVNSKFVYHPKRSVLLKSVPASKVPKSQV